MLQLTSFCFHFNFNFVHKVESSNAPNTEPEESSTRERIIYPDPELERDVYVEPAPFSMESLAAAHATRGSAAPGSEEEEFMQLLNSLRNPGNNPNFDGNAAGFAAFSSFGSFGGPNGGGGIPNDPLLAGLFGAQGAQAPPPPETRLRKLLNSKIHIAVLSVLTYVLINMAPFSCNVFLMFLLWEIVEIFILRQHQTNANGLVNVVFMMAGVSPTKINVFIKWIQLVNKVLRDIAIFLFFFVLSHITYLSVIGQKLVADGTISGAEALVKEHPFDGVAPSVLDDEFDDPFDVK